MSQLLSTLDVAMLIDNADVIMSLIQQSGFPNVSMVSINKRFDDVVIMMVKEDPTVTLSETIVSFFRDKLKLEIELCGVAIKPCIRSFKILSAEVSQVKITTTYDVCTVQSVLAAAVKEQEEVSVSESGREVIDNGIEISMPDTDMIEDATAQIAYERFDEETMHSSAREIGRSSVKKRWMK